MEVIILFAFSFIAAFLGTVVMTVGQEIELRINKRPISYTPALAVFKILRLDFERLSEKAKIFTSYLVHFGYGTFFGFPLVLLYLFGVTGFWTVTISYFFIVWIQGLIVIPLLGVAPPPWTWGTKAILTEIVHKAIYALATTAVFFVLLSNTQMIL